MSANLPVTAGTVLARFRFHCSPLQTRKQRSEVTTGLGLRLARAEPGFPSHTPTWAATRSLGCGLGSGRLRGPHALWARWFA